MHRIVRLALSLLQVDRPDRTGGFNALWLLAATAILPACESLRPIGNAAQFEPLDSRVRLTLTQRLDSGTSLQVRGSAAGLAGRGNIFVGHVGAIAASGSDIYVIDWASGALLRIDPGLREATYLARLANPMTHGLYASRNGTVYFVDKAARAVRQIDRDGRPMESFEDLNYAPSPVDVTESDWGSTVVVADELARQLVVFSPLGVAINVLGANDRRLAIAQVLHAIAGSRDSIFVLDSSANEVMRFDLRGRQTGSYGEDDLEMPTALAVDDCGRLFVADSSGAGILVSSFDMRVPPVRAIQNFPAERVVNDIWIDGQFLYLAAGDEGIRVYLVEPACSAY